MAMNLVFSRRSVPCGFHCGMLHRCEAVYLVILIQTFAWHRREWSLLVTFIAHMTLACLVLSNLKIKLLCLLNNSWQSWSSSVHSSSAYQNRCIVIWMMERYRVCLSEQMYSYLDDGEVQSLYQNRYMYIVIWMMDNLCHLHIRTEL